MNYLSKEGEERDVFEKSVDCKQDKILIEKILSQDNRQREYQRIYKRIQADKRKLNKIERPFSRKIFYCFYFVLALAPILTTFFFDTYVTAFVAIFLSVYLILKLYAMLLHMHIGGLENELRSLLQRDHVYNKQYKYENKSIMQ